MISPTQGPLSYNTQRSQRDGHLRSAGVTIPRSERPQTVALDRAASESFNINAYFIRFRRNSLDNRRVYIPEVRHTFIGGVSADDEFTAVYLKACFNIRFINNTENIHITATL